MAENKTVKKFFEQGGPRFFISTVTSTTREVYTSSHENCYLVQDWEAVFNFFRNYIIRFRTRVHFDRAEIFTKPRLCERCLEHAAQPESFGLAKLEVECLCFIEKDSRCDVHK